MKIAKNIQEHMEPSSLKVAFQGLILFILFLVFAGFTAEFVINYFSEDIIETCKAKADDILLCHRQVLYTWPYRQILFVLSSAVTFIVSLCFGFLFTKQYAEGKHKNLLYLALISSFYRVGLSVMNSSLGFLDIAFFLIVTLIIYCGLLLGHNTRSKIFNNT